MTGEHQDIPVRKGSLAHRKPRKGVAVAIAAIFVVRSALSTALRRLVPSKAWSQVRILAEEGTAQVDGTIIATLHATLAGCTQ